MFVRLANSSFLVGAAALGQDEAVELARSGEAFEKSSPHERAAYGSWQEEVKKQRALLEKAMRKGVIAELTSPGERVLFVEYMISVAGGCGRRRRGEPE
jgi:hypothetical protein